MRTTWLACVAAVSVLGCGGDEAGGGSGGSPSGGDGPGGSAGAAGSSGGGSAGEGSGGEAGGSSGGASGEGGASGGAGGTGGSGGTSSNAHPDTVRTCGGTPILGDYLPQDTPDACKECVDDRCCAEAQDCADDAACSALRECFASCTEIIGTCISDCLEGVTAPLNATFNGCRNGCEACMDVTSCASTARPVPAEASYPMTFTLTEYVSGGLLPDVMVEVCDLADVDCAAPLDVGTTDADGTVTVEIPSAPTFSTAYLQFSGGDIYPSLSFLEVTDAPVAFERGTYALALPSMGTADLLLNVMGATADPAAGIISANVLSCGNRPVPGATIASSGADTATIQQYLAASLPSASATATDSSGTAFFVNHPPGATTLEVQNSVGDVIITGEAFVRAGFISGVTLIPGP